MSTPGARTRLISELRRVGPRCDDAAEYLGLSIHIVNHQLPGDALFALDYPERRLIGRFDSEWSLWCGIAAFLSALHDLQVDLYTVMDAASVMIRRSGIMLVREIA